jgi:hypothetical protein
MTGIAHCLALPGAEASEAAECAGEADGVSGFGDKAIVTVLHEKHGSTAGVGANYGKAGGASLMDGDSPGFPVTGQD